VCVCVCVCVKGAVLNRRQHLVRQKKKDSTWYVKGPGLSTM
jgi:hypothetical protein